VRRSPTEVLDLCKDAQKHPHEHFHNRASAGRSIQDFRQRARPRSTNQEQAFRPLLPGRSIVRRAYSKAETIARLKQDIAAKGIRFFDEIDQAKLAADAGIQIRPSTLLVFGNPPLGTLFIRSNSLAGLDWPVRLLVFEDEQRQVWTAYTDFGYIAHRHDIHGMDKEAFDTAARVISAITSSVKTP